jgi:ABC-type sulfate/molybdate transport systems ATPase subunit
LRGKIGELELDVTLELERSPLVLIGPNGAGKTSLLRALAGARLPLEGHVRLGERTLFDSARGIDLAPEDRQIGYVPQGFGLFPHLTVLDNVAFACRRSAANATQARENAARVLARFDALAWAQRRPSELSGGQAQRVALARALAGKPELLLLDEPLSALDARARRELREHLSSYLRTQGPPAVLVSHDARDVWALGGTVVVLDAGRVVQSGSAAELQRAPGSEFVAEFFALPGGSA